MSTTAKRVAVQHREPAWEIARIFPLQGDWREEDYFRLPSTTRVELVDGSIQVLPMPSISHQLIVQFLLRLLYTYLTQAHPKALVLTASVPVRLEQGRIREPDLLVVLGGRESQLHDEYVERPDLVVEVVSPSNRDTDLIDKREQYAQSGIPEYWIVDPQAKTVTVLKLSGTIYSAHGIYSPGDVAQSALLRGFVVNTDDIWRAATGH